VVDLEDGDKNSQRMKMVMFVVGRWGLLLIYWGTVRGACCSKNSFRTDINLRTINI
jgi:hypothetical protein